MQIPVWICFIELNWDDETSYFSNDFRLLPINYHVSIWLCDHTNMASISLDECFAWLNVVYQSVSQCMSYVQKMMIKLCRKTICRFSLSIWIDARRRMSSWPPMLFRPENIFRTSYARVRMHTRMTIVNFLCDLNAKKRSVFLFLRFIVSNAMKQVGKLVMAVSPRWPRSIEHQLPKK